MILTTKAYQIINHFFKKQAIYSIDLYAQKIIILDYQI